jgi:hypothetical protein
MRCRVEGGKTRVASKPDCSGEELAAGRASKREQSYSGESASVISSVISSMEEAEVGNFLAGAHHTSAVGGDLGGVEGVDEAVDGPVLSLLAVVAVRDKHKASVERLQVAGKEADRSMASFSALVRATSFGEASMRARRAGSLSFVFCLAID